ncbi:hypothetical protein ANN_14782 [Periplaneta americana]|uniref:BZIP domain-containing protein n=1 Tax=Periplaneta americana TaxID=6978 RepID=A0ABQ8SYC2_PERAM|nr:hypothetical protein ANN_14782 [Periplaneta americana]
MAGLGEGGNETLGSLKANGETSKVSELLIARDKNASLTSARVTSDASLCDGSVIELDIIDNATKLSQARDERRIQRSEFSNKAAYRSARKRLRLIKRSADTQKKKEKGCTSPGGMSSNLSQFVLRNGSNFVSDIWFEFLK